MAGSPPATDASTALITVRTLLQLPVLRRAVPEVVAGGDALDRVVRWVHAGEVRTMPNLLKGGELLLTTGMGIGKSATEQRAFISALAARDVAALAIELGDAFPEISPSLVAEAARLNLPLIALHRETPFVEITETVHREIVNRQFTLMQRGEELHRRFADLMLDGAGIPEVLSSLAQAIGNPVVLDKHGHGVLYHAVHHTDDRTVLSAWDAAERGIDGAPACFALPVRTGGSKMWGRVVVLGLDTPLSDFDRVAVERAVGLIALALLRSRQEELLAARQRGNLLVGLIEGEVDAIEIADRAHALGFAAQPVMLPMAAARVRNGRPMGMELDETAWALLWRDIGRALAAQHTPALQGTRVAQQELLLVVGGDGSRGRGDLADRAAAIVHEAAARHLGSERALLLCAGRLSTSWEEVGAGLAAASKALPSLSEAPFRPWHDIMRPDLDRLLWSLRSHDDFAAFVQARLGPLLEHDEKRSSKLLPTLAAYCAHGGRKAETARALHLERQSLYHRLSRIEDLLNAELADEDTLLGLHLALRAAAFTDGRGNPR